MVATGSIEMKNVILLFTTCSLLSSPAWSAYVTTGSVCTTTTNDPNTRTLTFKVRDDAAPDDIGEVYGDGAYATCCAKTCTGAPKVVTVDDSDTPDEYTIVSTAGTPTCGGTYDAATNVLTLKVVVLKTANILEDEDKFYTATCDFSSSTSPTIDIGDELLKNKVQTVTPVVHPPDMRIILTSSSNEVSGSIALGTEVKIEAKVPTFVQPSFGGLKVSECKAKSSDKTKEIPLTDTNGCKDSNGIFTAGFTGSGDTAATFIALSPSFGIFRIIKDDGSTSAGVVFSCTITYTTNTAAQGDQCTTNTGKRRRREINLNEKTFVVSTNVYQVLLRDQTNPPKSTPKQPPHASAPPDDESEDLADVPTFVWIGVVTILCGTTALLAMAVVYLLRSREQQAHRKDAHAYPPSYNNCSPPPYYIKPNART